MRTTSASAPGVEEIELVRVGRIARAHGRRGEVVVDALTDEPARFGELERLFVCGPEGDRESFALEAARVHKGRPVLKLHGVDSIGEAEHLAGRELAIPQSDVRPLPQDGYYHFQLVGLAVEDMSGRPLGRVASVLSTGGTDVLVVEAGPRELLVPLCREHCPEIDPAAGRIAVRLPEGLWEMYAN